MPTYFGADFSASSPNGLWPAEKAQEFLYASEVLARSLRRYSPTIEGIAHQLLKKRTLERAEVESILDPDLLYF